jgi:hypothetical protein
MPYTKLKQEHPEYDPAYIQEKINLIVKGLPIDISEEELRALEEMLRGARSFYIDLLMILEKKTDEESKEHYKHEAMNLAGTELALRKVDDFRKAHQSQIKPQ